MNVRSLFRQHLVFYLFLGLSLIAAGCGGGSDSYDSPDTAANSPVGGSATNVLVGPATLKSWIDQGLVNSDDPFNDKVVILDFGGYDMDPDEDPLRIKGACRVPKAQLDSPRVEGVALANPLVPTGEEIDAIIQRLAIDEDTTVVFTSSTSPYYITRAYWVFRYWGFPQEKLKVLNGGDAAFAAEYPDLMTREVPAPTPSTFSVRDLEGTQPDLRASVGEFIEIIKNFDSDTDVILDARGDRFYSGSAPTSGQLSNDVVVFDGHPVGGDYLSNASVRDSANKYKSAEEIRAIFEEKGWEPGKRVTVYCTTGYSATPLFFALDAILGADVQLYDGSWSQLGKYSDSYANGGELPLNSPWAVDKYIGDLTYWDGTSNPLLIEPLRKSEETIPYPFLDDSGTPTGNPADPDVVVNPAANQVEEADLAAVGSTPTVTLDDPVETETDGVLIDVPTLQGWMDAGLVNAPTDGNERVVVLDVAFAAAYSEGHIPGALLWNIAGQVKNRLEGPATSVNMVIEPADMNARLQDLGIDENTTIVFTSSDTRSFFPNRAYFTFRYYGWPKSRLKVLNGYNFAWDQDELVEEETELAADVDSTLTVQQVANLQPDLRMALPELMLAAYNGVGTPVDMRGDNTSTGSTDGVFDDDHDDDGEFEDDYVVFEGAIKGGKTYDYTGFQVNPAKNDYRYKKASDIEADLKENGIEAIVDEPIYSYCRTAYIASTGFFVLDAILDWDVKVYDGSWSQWGAMSDNADKDGMLDSTDPVEASWALDKLDGDTYIYMDVVNYNKDHVRKVESLDPDSDALDLDPSDEAANQVESEDATYQATGGSSDGGSGAPTPVAPPASGC